MTRDAASLPPAPPQAPARFVAVVKRDCPTCRLVVPVLVELAGHAELAVYTQDDAGFPGAPLATRDDTALAFSHRHRIEVVPTLLRLGGDAGDGESARAEGWHRDEWRALTGVDGLGDGLVAAQPGCGSLSVAPGVPERLALAHGTLELRSRVVEVDGDGDAVEAVYDRGWSDGLPVVIPTDERVARMLMGTPRAPHESIGRMPPNLVACTVEKVAVNAVMAGCRPEYLPVVLAALEAMLEPLFSLHGLICTTWFSGPVLVVNGPAARRIGLNARGNVFGQGHRANATIGRAVQLVIRNVGGGRPGEIDRAVFGNPGKFGFCFAEDESDADWTPLNVARGFAPGSSTVTVFHGDGVQGVRAHRARDAASLTRSLAMGLAAVCHPKLYGWSGAILALSPDHHAIYRREGWDRAAIESALRKALRRSGAELAEGAGGVAEGIDPARAGEQVDKFHPGTLLVVRAGGTGSLLSAIIGGWAAMRRPHEVQPVTREI